MTEIREWVYEVRSNKPLGLRQGIGNVPIVSHGESIWANNLTVRDVIERAESNGAAQSLGLKMSMELRERLE